MPPDRVCQSASTLSQKSERCIYVGITGNFELRLIEHRTKKYPKSFTSQYNVTKLVYFEEYTRVEDAIVREKQLKGWRRSKKVALIEVRNPDWLDLGTE
jgi:putative endonuclease